MIVKTIKIKSQCVLSHRLTLLCALTALLGLTGCSSLVKGVDVNQVVPAKANMNQHKRVAVLPFESGRRLDEDTTSDVQAILFGVKVTQDRYFEVYEREKLAALIKEIGLGRSGLVDRATAIKLGKMAQVQAVVMGTVKDASIDKSRSRKEVYDCSSLKKCKKVMKSCVERRASYAFNPRIVDVADGQLLFGNIYSANSEETTCGGGVPNTSDAALLQKARSEAIADFRQEIAPYVRRQKVGLLVDYCAASGGKNNAKLKGVPCDPSGPTATTIAQVKSGYDYAKDNRIDRACDIWDMALRDHNGGFIKPYLKAVCFEVDQGRLEKALMYYERADLAVGKPVSVINDSLGRVQLSLKNQSQMSRQALHSSSSSDTARQLPSIDHRLRTAQKLLLEMGYQVGTPDGLRGEKTRAGLRQYQRDNALAETGLLDTETQQMLGLAN